MRTKEAGDRNTLYGGVIDAVAALTLGIPVPVAVLSARLIHYGVDRLCDDVTADVA